MAFSWIRRRRKHDPNGPEAAEAGAHTLSSMRLRVEDGLLMAFGPEGDPVPPALLRAACADNAVDEPRMESGATVDRKRVLAVIDAQQKGVLAYWRSDGWIEAMLGLGGHFEATPEDLLSAEPDDDLPPLPDDARPQGSMAISVPLTFDDAEQAAMSEADALLIRGLSAAMRLSAGHYDPSIDGWVVRPGDLTGLAIQRAADGCNCVDLDIMAVAIGGQGGSWQVTTRRIAFS